MRTVSLPIQKTIRIEKNTTERICSYLPMTKWKVNARRWRGKNNCRIFCWEQIEKVEEARCVICTCRNCTVASLVYFVLRRVHAPLSFFTVVVFSKFNFYQNPSTSGKIGVNVKREVYTQCTFFFLPETSWHCCMFVENS